MNNDYLYALVDAGVSVIPIAEGTKIPHPILGKTHDLLTRRATHEEVRKWSAEGVTSWAIAGGKVSGNLTTLDFDEKHYSNLYDLWYARLADHQKAYVDKCSLVRTRNNGKHLRYRTETPQPTMKLSRRIVGEKIETTAETKAEGGYALIPPSEGYTLIRGALRDLPVIPDDIHEELIDILRTFNEVVDEPATEYEWKPGETIVGGRPGDQLNALMPWAEVLEPHGWVEEQKNRWRRPGKKQGEGISATTDYDGRPMFYMFSSAAAPFEANKGYSKFHTFALLNHGGDYREAARVAAELYPVRDQDWEKIFSNDVLEQMREDTPMKVARKILQAMPEEAWPIGQVFFRRWNDRLPKPNAPRYLNSTWSSVRKSVELERKKKLQEKKVRPPRIRIAIIGTPTRLLTFEKWRDIIRTNFPDLVQAAEAAVSIPVQFVIKDVTNPFALVLVDVPSSGKTITINFLDGMIEITYTTDKFSAASFVSNAANVSKEELADVDLLPRIQYRMLLVRDLAPLFAKRADDLTESLGILTRVLDGEGLQTDSGVHGHRGYSGEYLFMILAASTPIQHHVWKVMGTLGSRLFFLGVHSRRKSEEELANQVVDKSYKEKERICREATRDFLYTLWNTHKEGIEWDKQADNKNVVALIARCAMMLARLRGVVNFWKDDFSDVERYEQPTAEQPDRITQLFYNFARGHALVCGRTSVADEDLRIILDMCFDSAPPSRTRLFRALIDHGGIMKTSEIEKELNCSKPTARKEMRTLEILGIVTQEEVTSGTGEFKMQLVDDLSWFLSDECRAIRGREAVQPEADDTGEAINKF